MEWLKNLSKAIDYIENNLLEEISYDDVAKIMCCSTYYFQRLFTYVSGVSLSEYIRRRRMTQAAFDLQMNDMKVLEVALKYGYASPTSFNRAFKSVHGISPVSAKGQGSVLNSYPPIKFSVKIVGGNAMSYRVEEKQSIRIVGIRIPLTFDMDVNKELVPPFWCRFLMDSQFTEICNLSNKPPFGVLGVSAYQSNGEIYYYIASSTDKPIPKGMFEYEIPAATWVIFESDGRFKESIQSIFRRFLTEWLPFSGYAYAELPDIEVYPISIEKPLEGHAEVWIAIKKEKELI